MEYFITITISRALPACPQRQFQLTVRGLASRLANSAVFTMHPELTKKGKLHYHIRCRITNKIYWYKTTLPYISSIGFYDIQSIKNNQSNMDYCNKDLVTMVGVLDYSRLPVTNKNWKQLKYYLPEKQRGNHGLKTLLAIGKQLDDWKAEASLREAREAEAS